jgi:two-component sensor histidine kinase/PAS domain-containing protein
VPSNPRPPRRESARPGRLAGVARRLAAPASAAGLVVLAMALRTLLGQWLTGLSVFSLFYPAILASALLGGGLSAAVALTLSFAVCLGFMAQITVLGPEAIAANMLLFLLTGACIGIVGSRLRTLLRRRREDFARLAEREARYRALFEGVSEGFAILEAVWDDEGHLADFVVVDANPALLAMFHADTAILGRRQSELYGSRDPDYIEACERAFRGQPSRLEVPSGRGRRWFDVRLSPVGRDRIVQLAVDVTERKAAETRRVEMFDELNHRVKNNLAAVSAMLSMQSRIAEHPTVREHLQKAVDRIETIGDVHASLYRASSTDEVDFGSYLRRLCERLATTIVDGERVRLEVQADAVMAPLDEAVALGLIVNELVTNAAKYAYPAPASGVIRVELRNAPHELRLTVRDEGVGLAEEGPTRGIGMRLVRSLVQQCKGEMQVRSSPGAEFAVRLPRHGDAPEPAPQSRLL